MRTSFYQNMMKILNKSYGLQLMGQRYVMLMMKNNLEWR